MVAQFMERTRLRQVHVLEHSMGGTVSLSPMLTHPGRVSKVAVVGSPMQGSGLVLLLKLSGRPRFAGLLHKIRGLLNPSFRLLCLTDSD
jgi:pimeloyl-ACP methyl ester carboxylesterase